MIYPLLILASVFLIYFPWFNFNETLSSGDWPYLFLENIQEFKIPTEAPFLWLDPYYQITAKLGVQVLSLSWETVEKIFWFYPYLILSLISSFLYLKYLTKDLIIVKNYLIFSLIGTLVFTTNTYILMLVGGGQMGVVMAYSIIPFVLREFFLIVNGDSRATVKEVISSSLILGIQLMFDPRISALTMLIVFLYFLFSVFTNKNFNIKILIKIIFIFIIAFLINLFWMIQNLGYFNQEYVNATVNASADFLSFATFSNSISLLHPNWPENIFGKIFFMKSEFIIIPIMAYVSLSFLNGSSIRIKSSILFFALIGLIGAFLAKGINPPFGEVYQILSGVPGFGAFRDPTKFYVLIVVSYMVLLPFSILFIASWISSRFKISHFTTLLPLLFLVFWLFLIRPAVFGQLSGTFKPHTVPREYVNLKDFLNAQPESTKTLWVPTTERFGFNSRSRPALSAMEILRMSSASGVLNNLDEPEVKKQLMDKKIKYVIVPYDFLSEIFITDRRYDEKLYQMTINELRNISWLSETNNNFGKIKIFEILNSK